MKRPSVALSSLLLCLAVWSVFSWPLPKMAGEAIPASARNVEEAPARYMFPGDHLQFFYHFTLVSHFASGRAPLFSNIYEFNTGSDEDRYSPGSYYAPFSLVFAALAPLTGPAAAWNLVGLLSLWITLWATWALLRRYVDDPWIVWAAALISIALPFRWTTRPIFCLPRAISAHSIARRLAAREAAFRGRSMQEASVRMTIEIRAIAEDLTRTYLINPLGYAIPCTCASLGHF